ncbi:MAG: T9SS type A sorting domain-containing protein [Bacteroidales bacterium]|nr:T9SS type A sorting domain-containing protein [Bacteroidales bacterium]
MVNNSLTEVTVFPNPTTGKVTVRSNVWSQGQVLNVYDLRGCLLFSTEVTSEETEIDFSNRPKGVYFLRLNTGKATVGTSKLIVN